MLSICKNTNSAFEGTVISHFSEKKITKNNTSVPKRYTYVKSGSTDLGTEKPEIVPGTSTNTQIPGIEI